eukprot:1029216-Pyramimonas_sp.AAC.1
MESVCALRQSRSGARCLKASANSCRLRKAAVGEGSRRGAVGGVVVPQCPRRRHLVVVLESLRRRYPYHWSGIWDSSLGSIFRETRPALAG